MTNSAKFVTCLYANYGKVPVAFVKIVTKNNAGMFLREGK